MITPEQLSLQNYNQTHSVHWLTDEDWKTLILAQKLKVFSYDTSKERGYAFKVLKASAESYGLKLIGEFLPDDGFGFHIRCHLCWNSSELHL